MTLPMAFVVITGELVGETSPAREKEEISPLVVVA